MEQFKIIWQHKALFYEGTFEDAIRCLYHMAIDFEEKGISAGSGSISNAYGDIEYTLLITSSSITWKSKRVLTPYRNN